MTANQEASGRNSREIRLSFVLFLITCNTCVYIYMYIPNDLSEKVMYDNIIRTNIVVIQNRLAENILPYYELKHISQA